MDWHKLLLTAVAVSSLGLGPTLGAAAAAPAPHLPTSTCVGWGASQGSCTPPAVSGSFNNGGVDLSAEFENGSGGGGQGAGEQGGGPGDDDQSGAAGGQKGTQNGTEGGAVGGGPPGPDAIVRDGFIVNCTPGSPCDPNLVVRVSDLVNFKPMLPVQGMEPPGWMVVGLPTNFFATAFVHTRSGSLLGFPAEVRFTPAGYSWDYGDGSARRSMTGGAPWAALGLPEFSQTATSHSFSERATRVITLVVSYSAQYRFAGQGWRNVAGSLTVPADPLTAIVGDARTVLVDRDCLRRPRGPGC
jgi:hypothetical protein